MNMDAPNSYRNLIFSVGPIRFTVVPKERTPVGSSYDITLTHVGTNQSMSATSTLSWAIDSDSYEMDKAAYRSAVSYANFLAINEQVRAKLGGAA